MHTSGPKEDPLVDMGYEVRDVDYPKLRKAIYWFFGFGILSFVLGYGVYVYRNSLFLSNARNQMANASLSRRLPEAPNPLLQNNVVSKTDIAVMRQAETSRLEGTGYVDDTHTKVYIPIDKAMDLIVERGVPKVGAVAPAPGVPSTRGESATPTPGNATTTSPGTNPIPSRPVPNGAKPAPAPTGTPAQTAVPQANRKP